jgi:hypothetical protein
LVQVTWNELKPIQVNNHQVSDIKFTHILQSEIYRLLVTCLNQNWVNINADRVDWLLGSHNHQVSFPASGVIRKHPISKYFVRDVIAIDEKRWSRSALPAVAVLESHYAESLQSSSSYQRNQNPEKESNLHPFGFMWFGFSFL